MPMDCLHCNSETNNPKFCSRSCAASFNNVGKHRNPPKERCCVRCDATYIITAEHSSRKICPDCRNNLPTSKVCSSCSIKKPSCEFYIKGREGRLQSKCKSCFNSYVARRWHHRKLEAIHLMGDKCQDCGFDNHPAALQFHHVDGSKEMDWSKMRQVSHDKMIEELGKCVLLCANCHCIRHATNWKGLLELESRPQT